MTCVVGIVNEDGRITIAADSSAVDNNIVTRHARPKVFTKGEFGIGYCHSFRLGQILEFHFDPPPMKKKMTEDEIVKYMITEFIPQMRVDLSINDYPTHDDEKENWGVMVGIRGHLFIIESDFHLSYDEQHYAAMGAGIEYALGAMHGMDTMGGHQNKNLFLESALLAAERYCPYVVKPFDFIEV